MTKSNLERKGFISSHSLSPSSKEISVGTQSWDMEVRTETEIMKERCLLAGYQWFAQSAFLYTPEP